MIRDLTRQVGEFSAVYAYAFHLATLSYHFVNELVDISLNVCNDT